MKVKANKSTSSKQTTESSIVTNSDSSSSSVKTESSLDSDKSHTISSKNSYKSNEEAAMKKARVEFTEKDLRNIMVEQKDQFTPKEVYKITPNGYLFFQMRTALINEIRRQNKQRLN